MTIQKHIIYSHNKGNQSNQKPQAAQIIGILWQIKPKTILIKRSNVIHSKILTFLSWGKLLSFKNIAAANDDENISS